jgi:hypothetical protein
VKLCLSSLIILLLLPGFYSPIQAKTALTMPLHRILSDAL